MRRLGVLLSALALAAGLGASAPSASAEGRAWDHYEARSAWIGTDDPLVTMHAEIQRAPGTDWAEPQPVIVVATPYGNHSGQSDYRWFAGARPNGRFHDFLALSGALERGYTFVTVDLPGYGGSSGCSDLGGPLEQAAVRRAVEWAATQPWSSGAVALFGKSYDGWTALMGLVDPPPGLRAAVAMEPLYSAYLVDHGRGVRKARSFILPAVYASIDAQPGTIDDAPMYQANTVPRPHCSAVTQAQWLTNDPDLPFWRERDLRALASPDVPAYVTQGFLETNTVSRGLVDFMGDRPGSGHRQWLGQFEHVRGWERWGEAFLTGRSGFVDDVMAFLDVHLKGLAVDQAPAVSVQDGFGRHRLEASWPPADVRRFVTAFDGSVWPVVGIDRVIETDHQVRFAAVPHDVWIAGEPVVTLDVTATAPGTGIMVQLLVAYTDSLVMEITHEAHLIRDAGTQQIRLPLMPQDHVIPTGSRLLLRIGPPDGRFVHPADGGAVLLHGGSLDLPLLTEDRTTFVPDSQWFGLPWRLEQSMYGFQRGTGGIEMTLAPPIDVGDLRAARCVSSCPGDAFWAELAARQPAP